MTPVTPAAPASGVGMDTIVPRRRYGRWIALAAGVAGVVAAAFVLWELAPHGLQVNAQDLRIVPVKRDLFHDDIIVRATAMPLSSVILDAVQSGRVEEVIARDGAVVVKGDLLFRLSNPQQTLDLLARQSDQAQQISNLSNLQVNFELGRAEDQRRLARLEHDLRKAQRDFNADADLAAKGFISPKALEESRERMALQKQLLDDDRRNTEEQQRIRRSAMEQMQRSMKTIDAGLRLVDATVDALAVRAPVAGRLTDFNLQVGETVKPGDHTGRIDDPSHFKLSVQVDEFYLQRVSTGLGAHAQFGGQDHALTVSRIYPQIKDGRFTVELTFTGKQPGGIHPGQTLDAQIVLGEPSQALLVPNSAFVADSGAAWIYVVDADGRSARRRAIRIGRRNNQQLEVLSGVDAGERVIVSSYSLYGKAERLDISR